MDLLPTFGPVEGRRHDAFILTESCLLSKLQQFKRPNGEPYVIYGDPAYGVTAQVLSPYRTNGLTAAEQEFNRRMSAVRVSVEWTFGKVLQYFSFLDYKKNHKVLLQPTGKYYLVGASHVGHVHLGLPVITGVNTFHLSPSDREFPRIHVIFS